MANYCFVENGKIIEGPKPLPINWRHISNLPALSNDELVVIGWLLVEYPELVFDPATQNRLADTLEVIVDTVFVTFNIEDKTQEELDADAAVIAEAEATAYIKQRENAHIKIGDQLDMQYWDLVNGTTFWKDYVAAIKVQFPKPE